MIVDAGGDADFLLEEIQRRNLTLLGIFATHGHFDHILAVGEIQLSFDVPLYIFREDLFLVKRLGETVRHFLGKSSEATTVQPKRFEWLEEGNLRIADFELRILKTPGHTPGAACLLLKKENVVFTGDTLFKGAIGRYDFSYSDKGKLKKSLSRLFELPAETLVYPGHGEETTIGEEKNLKIL